MHIFSAEKDEMCQISQVIISIFKVVVGLNLTIFEGKKFTYIRLKGVYGYWFLNNVIEDQKKILNNFFLLSIEPLLR